MSLVLCLRLRQPFRLVLSARLAPPPRPPRRFPWPPPTLPRSASFFPWSAQSNPSLDAAAEIATLEAHVNADPDNVQKQLAFFKALVATRSKQGYDTLIDRWEHACERVRAPFTRTNLTQHSPESRISPPTLR